MDNKKALSKAMKLCSQKEYCIAEITEKLYTWSVSENDISEILDYLTEEKFIDEERYIRKFVKDKIWLNKWGRRKVEYALKFKKVKVEMVKNELDKLDEEKYKLLIAEVLQQKMATIRDNETMKIKAKLFNFGASRGYETDFLYSIVEDLIKKPT